MNQYFDVVMHKGLRNTYTRGGQAITQLKSKPCVVCVWACVGQGYSTEGCECCGFSFTMPHKAMGVSHKLSADSVFEGGACSWKRLLLK